jgi:4-carboxymuconolactone decarboxylase
MPGCVVGDGLLANPAGPAASRSRAARESGVTGDDIQAAMIGVAPVVGTARVVAASGNILRGLGLAIAVADAELADESDAGQ